MTSGSPADIIAVTLFDYVVEYAERISNGEATVSDRITSKNELVVFADNFLTQFAKGYLRAHIEGFNSRSQRQLKKARRKLENKRNSKNTGAAQRLIFRLEPLCDHIPEISYGNSEIESDDFHINYITELLDRIVDWLTEYNCSEELRTAATKSRDDYNAAIESVTE